MLTVCSVERLKQLMGYMGLWGEAVLEHFYSEYTGVHTHTHTHTRTHTHTQAVQLSWCSQTKIDMEVMDTVVSEPILSVQHCDQRHKTTSDKDILVEFF